MSTKKQKFLTMYVDASFIEEINEGLGGVVWTFNANGHEETGSVGLKIGTVKNSMHAEYKIAESALDYALNKIINGHAPHKIKVKIITDNLGLFQSFNKLNPPPVQTNLSHILNRLTINSSKFKNFEISWTERENNPAGKVVQAFLKEYKSSEKFLQRLKNPSKNENGNAYSTNWVTGKQISNRKYTISSMCNELNLDFNSIYHILLALGYEPISMDTQLDENIYYENQKHLMQQKNFKDNSTASLTVNRELISRIEKVREHARNSMSALSKLINELNELQNIIKKNSKG